MRGFGAMVSFVLAGGEAAALEVVRRTELWTLAESLGAVESLIEHPARMTHASVSGSPLEVDAGLVRLSVGIETGTDLVADLAAALDAAGSEHPKPDGFVHVGQAPEHVLRVVAGDVGDDIADVAPGAEGLALDVDAVLGEDGVDRGQNAGRVAVNVDQSVGPSPGR